jgi:L-rhamnose mutarotase
MNEKELKETMQYWWSQYCNSCMKPEKNAYLKVYNALKEVYKLKYNKKNPA